MPDLSPKSPRLLYLGFAFPPGVASLHPGVNPAGHGLETQMTAELRRHFEVRSAGVLPFEFLRPEGADPASGIAHELLLLEKSPELFHRWRSLARLKEQYARWLAAGWEPNAVLVYNLSPIYNQFVRWLRRQAPRPKLVLLLLDSPDLGREVPRLKRFRRRFKPLLIPDSEMLPHFDACIGLSREVERYFAPVHVPFLWMPGGCTPARARGENAPAVPEAGAWGFPSPREESPVLTSSRIAMNVTIGIPLPPLADRWDGSTLPEFSADAQLDGQISERNMAGRRPIRLGYFGALAAHAGIEPLVETFLRSNVPATLEVCGYGKLGPWLAELAGHEPRLKYHGLLPTPDHCLRFGRGCDVLVNPRPTTHGNANNFPSKLFDYALAGRVILTSRLSGVEAVLGPEAYYFDPHNFSRSLGRKLVEVCSTPGAELLRRGTAVQRRILAEFSWQKQGARIAEFLDCVCGCKRARPEIHEALAA